MLERLGIFAILFILLLRYEGFQRLISGSANRREKVVLSVAFGFAGIAATYGGLPFYGAIANLRGVAVALAGILGGPIVGFSAGVIAGSHRFLMDPEGLTALSCGLATIVQGGIAGMIYMKWRKHDFDAMVAASICIVNELLKMVFILAIAKPFAAALHLVQHLVIPSMLVNGLGAGIFVHLLGAYLREKEFTLAEQAKKTLDIALTTLPYLRNGLTEESAGITAKIIQTRTSIDAVSVSNTTEILAFEGTSCQEKYLAEVFPGIIEKVVVSGEKMVIDSSSDWGRNDLTPQFNSGIIVPLYIQGEVVGSFGLFRLQTGGMTTLDSRLVNGLSQLFSTQLELAEVEKHRKLASTAEIKALQAQISPHFFFNALNTITSFTKTDPDAAAALLIRLSRFIRRNIEFNNNEVKLEEELEHCKAYIDIEKARFSDKITAVFSVDKESLDCLIPSFILQPLVENGIRHGLLPLEGGGTIGVDVRRREAQLFIKVYDNGVGISSAKVADLYSQPSAHSEKSGFGIALNNVLERLRSIYGKESDFCIDSTPGQGTTISLVIPAKS